MYDTFIQLHIWFFLLDIFQSLYWIAYQWTALFLFQLYFIGSDSDILAWLFADTPKGAFANGVLYTLVESARANELDVYEYLKYLLTETPNNHHLEDPSVIDSLLPWSKELPEQCLLKRNRKKCLKHWCRYYSRNSGFFFSLSTLFPILYFFYRSFNSALSFLVVLHKVRPRHSLQPQQSCVP